MIVQTKKFSPPTLERECKRCHEIKGIESFIKTSSPFFMEGYTDICGECLNEYLEQKEYSWGAVDKLCQYLDIPFIPKKFEELKSKFGDTAFSKYAEFFGQLEYEGLSWGEYFKEFKHLKETGYIEDELPLLQDRHRRELKEKWGFNYDDEALFYLESLYEGLLASQNIAGALQVDQALKLCKISYELDLRIQGGATDVDKLISSYEKLIKTAEFTPKNIKNASDFDSIGELIKWLEKRGFINQYYDNVTRDVVDETIKNLQSYNQRLYTNETGIGDQITERIQALKNTEKLDTYYDLNPNEDLDKYDNDGYKTLMDEEEFIVDLEE